MLLTALLILAQPIAEPEISVGRCAIPSVAFQQSIAIFIGPRLDHARPLRWQWVCGGEQPVRCAWVDAGDGRGWRPFWVTAASNRPEVHSGEVLMTDDVAEHQRFRRLCNQAGYERFDPPPPVTP
jgi:hypothetical protein